jgi:penicillin-binding protein 1C
VQIIFKRILILAAFSIIFAHASSLPTFPQVQQDWQSSYATLLDRNGQVLIQQRINKQEHRFDWTPLNEVSPALLDALLFVEDKDFYKHHGVDWGAVSRSAVNYLTGQKARGASTLTMQLSALLNNNLSWQRGGRTLSRKWQQLQAAKQLEKTWTKNQILEAYLNLTMWRGDLQGISTASLALFGKWPRGLNRNESILLVSLLNAPNASSNKVAQRACVLIKAGYDAHCDEVKSLATISLHNRKLPFDDAPDIQALASRLLKEPQQQLRISIDKPLQHYVYQSLRTQLASLMQQQANAGAVLVLNNQTGEVLAYVANSGLVDDSIWVDGVQALRQAGSTLKPFLYGLALDKNLLTAASVLDDQAINVSTELGLYVPQNYEKDFKGAVTVRRALASSLNIPAVLTLNKVGVEDFWRALNELGFKLEQQSDYYGHALALGGADITLWQLANAYRALANGGQKTELSLALNTQHTEAKAVLSPQASFIVADILSDRNARSLSFGYENPLATPFWTAVKTGTSKDMRDNWCVGFSRHFTVAVWVGNMQGLPMRDVSGITGAAPIWHGVMSYLEAGREQQAAIISPQGVVQQFVNFEGFTQPAYNEWFIAGTEQTKVSYQADTVATIIYPVTGTRIALDPDMPLAVQKVFFKARIGGESLHFWLNDDYIASAKTDYAWQPRRGRYHLRLKTASGQTRAEVNFEVRGKLKPIR